MQGTHQLIAAFDSLADRRLLMFGGKGGVGKTTLASLAALHLANTRETILFSTDPASNLGDVFGDDLAPNLRIETIEAEALYRRFLEKNLASFLELGDRGTYLDRDEIQRFFELSIPGIDELMGWLRIGELLEENARATVVVDTAPTGHTLRMLCSSAHFEQFGEALESMQSKHRELVAQLARRRVRDAMDQFLEQFRADAERRHAIITDPKQSGFLTVFLSEPWVVEQTKRLIGAVRNESIAVPLAILNRAVHDCDCARCRNAAERESRSIAALPAGVAIVRAPRACSPLGTAERLEAYLRGELADPRVAAVSEAPPSSGPLALPPETRMLFVAGKGGVGKTTSSASIALKLAGSGRRVVLLSVDPAHSVRDVFAHEKPPDNLTVETIDTRLLWRRLRESLGDAIENAIDALTPKGVSLAHDTDVMKRLLAIAPPGADELFAIERLSELLREEAFVVVDTAPTGHFLRLLELPKTATEWVHEFMRLLLKYKELIPPSALGEELLAASRALSSFAAALKSPAVAALVVTRPDPLVMRETSRLLRSLDARGVAVAAVIANYVTPRSDCSCDRTMRASEIQIVAEIDRPLVVVERRDHPPVTLEELESLF